MDENRTSILLSRAPHAHLPGKSTGVCADVLLAAAPAALLAVVSYGVRALLLMLLSALTAGLVTALFALLSPKSDRGDALYACLSGLLCALFFGAGCALWIAALAGFLCALGVIWGRLQGRRALLHPAMCAYLILFAIFPDRTAAYTQMLDGFRGFFSLQPAARADLAIGRELTGDALLLGGGSGMLGAANPLALLIGFGYLVLRRVAALRAPAFAAMALFILSLFFPDGHAPFAYAFSMLLSGGFLIGLVFFLCPMGAAPMSRRGQMLFGLGYGALTFLFRALLGADGAVSALVLLECFVFALDSSLRAQTFRASRFGARVEAVLLRGAHTRRESARRSDSRRTGVQTAQEPEPEPEVLPPEEAVLPEEYEEYEEFEETDPQPDEQELYTEYIDPAPDPEIPEEDDDGQRD